MFYRLSLHHVTFSHSPSVRMLRTVLALVFLAPLRGCRAALEDRAQRAHDRRQQRLEVVLVRHRAARSAASCRRRLASNRAR